MKPILTLQFYHLGAQDRCKARDLAALISLLIFLCIGQYALATDTEFTNPPQVGPKELNNISTNEDQSAADESDHTKKLRKLAAEGDAESQYELGVALMIEAPLGSGENAAKSFDWFRKAAEQGLAEAQNELGRCYLNGEGVEKNLDQAFAWFQKAAAQGNVASQNSLGDCYQHGWGVDNDPIQSAACYNKAAENGSVYAQYSLALCYKEGSGVEKNPVQAIKWCREAAEKRLAHAQLLLGIFYYDGTGIEKDPAQAVVWFRKAADRYNVNNILDMSAMAVDPCGNLEMSEVDVQVAAEFYLGLCFETGDGVEKDLGQAISLYRNAALRGHADAQNRLGVCFENGSGVEKDPLQAARWYGMAAEQGNEEAQHNLNNIVRTVAWMRKAAERGNAIDQFNLGICFAKGEGVEKDPVQAAFWYRKAAEQGDAPAQNNLGICFKEGEGVEQDFGQAEYWYRKAAEQGNAQAHFNLGQLYINGEGVVQDDRQACVHFLIAGALGNSIAPERIKLIRKERLTGAGYEDAQQEAKDWMKKFKNERQTSTAPGDGNAAVRPSDELSGSGSGFVISADGYFLTCAHVIEGGNGIKVCFGDKTYPAQLIRADVNNDVALLKLDGADFRPLALSPSLPEMGDKVFTVGFPNPELQGSSAKYTDGVISSLFGIIDDVRTMQITVPIQGGNSGGPLVDAAGNVLGLVVAQLNAATVFEYTGTIPQNVNFAVKINYALPIVQSVPGLAKNLPQPRTATPDARPVADVQAATGLVFVYE